VISAQSMLNVEVAFHKAIRANLVREESDFCTIAPIEPDAPGTLQGHKLLLITISSFVFRVIVIFRIIDNPVTRAYYLTVNSPQTLDEVFAEVANMCGGRLNRELSVQFAHLAMSTPYALNSECMAFLDGLRPEYVARYGVTINDSVQLQATLCMCCSRPIEIAASTAAADEVDAGAGELELF